MKILFLAPHPFYSNRGTPIAVKLACEGLAALGHSVDVLTYHVGEPVDLPCVTVHRIKRPPLVGHVPIGPSWQKLICDCYMYREMGRMLLRNRYDLVHAVEESVFMAARGRIPFIFDMDSLMSRQLVEKSRLLWPVSKVFAGLERHALRHCVGVAAVCETLAVEARKYHANVHLLPDVALAGEAAGPLPPVLTNATNLRLMYVGNLEYYQGVDLMLAAFALAAPHHPAAVLLVVGGKAAEIERYAGMAEALGVRKQVEFVGPVPVDRLGRVLRCADILLSPRIKGANTPMKLYSYLLSGKPVLATRLIAHTQVVGDEHALLVEPTAAAMAVGMRRLLDSAALREQYGDAGRGLAARSYSMDAFHDRLKRLYESLPPVGTSAASFRQAGGQPASVPPVTS